MQMLPDIAPSALESILARERRWAERSGLSVDASGHLVDAVGGLCFTPSSEHLERLERHPDRPLGEDEKPSPIGLLGSAWAIACNLVESVPTDALGGLLAALGAPGRAVRRGWVHPSHDLDAGAAAAPLSQIDREGAGPLFVEILGAELALGEAARPSALPRPEAGWGDLEGCRRLAGESMHGPAAVIPVRALLRRLRTLCRSHGRRGFRYVVVRPQFDPRFDDVLRRAFDGLRMRIGGEIDFDALDVSTLHTRLTQAGDAAHPALGWLADRYLDETRARRGA